MRQLATLQKIKSLEPIEWADKLEKATVLWREIVVVKWLHYVWELICYIEIDSFLPEHKEFEFLRDRCFKMYWDKAWFRLRTIKLRWQISQWLIIPYSSAININPRIPAQEGEDITKELWIIKYDSELLREIREKENHQRDYARKWRGKWIKWLFYRVRYWFFIKIWRIKFDKTFPSFIPKTDETRVQVLGSVLSQYKWTKCYATEKLDGSSITCFLHKWKFWVCSRNLELVNSDNNFWHTVEKLGVEKIMRESLSDNIAIQGELVWPWIQWNKYNLEEHDIYRFNCYDIKTQKYRFPSELESKGLKIVPIVWRFELIDNIKELVELAKWDSLLGKVPREWIVIRPEEEIENVHKMWRLSFKSINPDFLLKYWE